MRSWSMVHGLPQWDDAISGTGAAQHYRDARITPIYEGTNGIQAIDLVTRKLPLSEGATVKACIDGIRRSVAAVEGTNNPAFGWTGLRLRDAVDSLDRATQWLLARQHDDRDSCARRATEPISRSAETDMRRFDLMYQINTRGTFMVSKYAIAHLEKGHKATRRIRSRLGSESESPSDRGQRTQHRCASARMAPDGSTAVASE